MRRKEKVREAIRKEMSRLLQEELHDPRIGFVTIIGVDISDDLRNAKIYYSVLGDKKAEKNTIEAMNSALGFIRKNIAEAVNLRFAPEIILRLDRSAQEAIDIEKKLEDLKNNELNQNNKHDKQA